MEVYKILNQKREELIVLCAKHHVLRLEIFGSATNNHFNPNTSDLDFLVEFQELSPGKYADAYFGLLEDLEESFNRPVDLVMISAIKNHYFLESIRLSRIILYAA